jgi:hypothetical protein
MGVITARATANASLAPTYDLRWRKRRVRAGVAKNRAGISGVLHIELVCCLGTGISLGGGIGHDGADRNCFRHGLRHGAI